MSEILMKVVPYGAMQEWSTEPLECDARDMRDVISALKCWFPQFQAFMHEHPEFSIVLTEEGGKNPIAVEQEFFNAPFGEKVREIHMFPTLEGADFVTAAYAAFVLVVGATVAQIVVSIAISLAISAIMQMLTPKPKTGNAERPAEQPSFLFNGPENVQEAGYQVPMVYGTHMTGSVVVSAGIQVTKYDIPPTKPITTVPRTPDQYTGEEEGGRGA